MKNAAVWLRQRNSPAQFFLGQCRAGFGSVQQSDILLYSAGVLKRRSITLALSGLLVCAVLASADVVKPLDDVTTGVVIRASASSSNAIVGTLKPNEQAELLGSVPYWHKVKLPSGVTGFVSKRWKRFAGAARPRPPASGPERPS